MPSVSSFHHHQPALFWPEGLLSRSIRITVSTAAIESHCSLLCRYMILHFRHADSISKRRTSRSYYFDTGLTYIGSTKEATMKWRLVRWAGDSMVGWIAPLGRCWPTNQAHSSHLVACYKSSSSQSPAQHKLLWIVYCPFLTNYSFHLWKKKEKKRRDLTTHRLVDVTNPELVPSVKA